MSELWFTSDHHFGHANILSYCKGRAERWSSVEEMNVGLIERWNAVVAPTDRVYVLGDAAMGKRAETVPLYRQLNGRKVLVPGNHDNCWEKGRDGSGSTPGKLAKHEAQYMEWGGFEHILQPPMCVHYDGVLVWLTHLPPIECGDHKEGEAVYDNEIRFFKERPPYPPDDAWMLCGHVHEAWKQHGRVINVGVDVWDYAPVNWKALKELMKEGGE